MSNLILDYSAYKAWMFCPWNWYELYVNRVCKVNPYQRKDNMAIGSLVHAGLEVWHAAGVPEVPAKEIEKVNPTQETLGIAQQILAEYVQRYPTEPWKAVAFEKPLLRGYPWGTLLAKLDAYTIIEEVMQVPDGVGGTLTLNPGLYGIEHKTKDEQIEAGKYRKRWLVNRQADFQMLALQANPVQESTEAAVTNGTPFTIGGPVPRFMPVQGIIVNIIDKPRPYVPKSKCKSCGVTNELAMWIAMPEKGMWSCRECGNMQHIQPKGAKVERKFEFWRMLVERTAEQLQVAEAEITNVACSMSDMIHDASCGENVAGDITLAVDHTPNREMCIHPITYHECQFFEPHLQGFSTVGNSQYVQVEDYRGL